MPVLPWHKVGCPVTTGDAGALLVVTGIKPLVVPHEFERVTVTFPLAADDDQVVVMEAEPCPDVMFTPEGTVQL